MSNDLYRKNAYLLILKNLKNTIEKLDEEFRNSKERKLNNWIISRYKYRLFKTIYGNIIIKITMYKYKKDGKWKTVLFENEYLKKMKNCNIDKELIEEILNYKGYLSYRKIANLYPEKVISLATISNIFSKFKPKNNYQQITKNNQITADNKVYIEMDDAYFHYKINNKKATEKTRLMVLHNGKNEKNEIINKTIIHEIKSKNNYLNSEQLALSIKKIANEIYGENLKFIVIGDGARYIKTIAKKLNAVFILDTFHCMKKLFFTIGYNQNNTKNKAIFRHFKGPTNQTFYLMIRDLILNNQVNLAISKLKNIVQLLKKIKIKKVNRHKINNKIEEIIHLIKYLKSNYLGLQHFNKSFNIGSRTEAFVSHTLKKIIKKKFSLYSLATIKNLLFLNNAKANQNYILLS